MKRTMKIKRGDSIIEVLLAVAIFSAVAVSSLATMNRGLANVETALEETVARSEIDAQANLIRYIYSGYTLIPGSNVYHDAASTENYAGVWDKMVNGAGDSAAQIETTCTNNHPEGFVLMNNKNGISFQKINQYTESGGIPKSNNVIKDDETGSYGNDIWITTVKGGDDAYYDFFINTCWYSPGSSTGTTLYTTIRLVNPEKA